MDVAGICVFHHRGKEAKEVGPAEVEGERRVKVVRGSEFAAEGAVDERLEQHICIECGSHELLSHRVNPFNKRCIRNLFG